MSQLEERQNAPSRQQRRNSGELLVEKLREDIGGNRNTVRFRSVIERTKLNSTASRMKREKY